VRVAGHSNEAMVFVERRSLVVYGVYDDQLAARLFRSVNDLLERTHEQYSPEPGSLGTLLERELCEEDGGDLPWRSAPNLRRHRVALQKVRRDGEIADDRLVASIDDHVGTCALTRGVPRVLLQPLIEWWLPARELIEDVRVAKRFDAMRQAMRRSSRASFAARARRGARSARSIAASSRSKYFAGTAVVVRAAITWAALSAAAVTMNAETD